MAKYLYLWPNGAEEQISGWIEIDFQNQQAYRVTNDGKRAEQVELPDRFCATTDDLQNYQYHHKGKKRSKPSATSHEEYVDGQWQTINTNIFDESAPSLFSILKDTSIAILTKRILFHLDIEPERITKDIKTLDDLILFVNKRGEITDFGLEVIRIKVKDLIKNSADLDDVLGKILNANM